MCKKNLLLVVMASVFALIVYGCGGSGGGDGGATTTVDGGDGETTTTDGGGDGEATGDGGDTGIIPPIVTSCGEGTGKTASDCLAAVNIDYTQARDVCVDAAITYGDETSNDADTARFFAGLTRVLDMGLDLSSDGDRSNGLQTVGEILEASGCDNPKIASQTSLGRGTFSCSPVGSWRSPYTYDSTNGGWFQSEINFLSNGTFTAMKVGGSVSVNGNYTYGEDWLQLTIEGVSETYTYSANRTRIRYWGGSNWGLNIPGIGYVYSSGRIFPSNSPTVAELEQFIDGIVKTEATCASVDLNNISEGFNTNWNGLDGNTVESDYGDVLAFKASAEAFLASILIAGSYNFDVDIDEEINHTHRIKEEFLNDNPDFLKLKSASELSTAKNHLLTSTDRLMDAINWMDAETDDQLNDFISLGSKSITDIDNMKSDLIDAKTALTGDNFNIYDHLGDSIGTLNLSNFFAGINIRELLPSYNYDTPGLFPDPTFGGVFLTGPNGPYYPNRDVQDSLGAPAPSGDGIPDILQ